MVEENSLFVAHENSLFVIAIALKSRNRKTFKIICGVKNILSNSLGINEKFRPKKRVTSEGTTSVLPFSLARFRWSRARSRSPTQQILCHFCGFYAKLDVKINRNPHSIIVLYQIARRIHIRISCRVNKYRATKFIFDFRPNNICVYVHVKIGHCTWYKYHYRTTVHNACVIASRFEIRCYRRFSTLCLNRIYSIPIKELFENFRIFQILFKHRGKIRKFFNTTLK